MTRFGVSVCALIGALVASPIYAETPTVYNEYIFDGTELRCAIDPSTLEGATQEEVSEAGLSRCLSMGDLHILMSRADAEALLPAPKGEGVMFQGALHYTYVYVIDRQPAGYYVVGYYNDIVVSIQATGREVLPPARFSSVGLGTSSQEIRDRFGPPEAIRPVAELGGEEWVYGLFSFIVLEPIGVYSIRLEVPEMTR